VQLYNEKLYDIMSFTPQVEHRLRWNSQDMFFIEGLKSNPVQTAREAM
jgi:hypothetical protein